MAVIAWTPPPSRRSPGRPSATLEAVDLAAVTLRGTPAVPVVGRHASDLCGERLALRFALERLLVQGRRDTGRPSPLRYAANVDDVLERRLPYANLVADLNHLRTLGARAVHVHPAA